jgi:hypothetical protein
MHKKEIDMRLHFHTAVPALVTLVGSVSALFAPASASEADPASDLSGSLGVSLDDLAFGTGAGTTVFLLNAGFLLLFAAMCIVAVRLADSGRDRHIPFRAVTKFAR